MLLKDWFFVRSGKYTAINGIVDSEGGKFPEGSRITTSRIAKMDFNNMVAQTRNSVYALEKLDKLKLVEHTFADSQSIGV
jgi:hypothetical protein